MLLAAIGLSSPQAANGGGPKGQALQAGGGEQTIEPAIGQREHNAPTGGASGAQPWGQDVVSFARMVTTANAHIDATAKRIAHRERCRRLPIPRILLGILAFI